MTDLIRELRNSAESSDTMGNLLDEAADELERLRLALHEVCEEWAGSECGEPMYVQEAYAINVSKRMWKLAAEALGEQT
jgi:hypothetical protein